ncbi:MAG: rhomboid family intramembrane serine protease [Acidobacteria bacterium]|nr:rhomboid family intramembrane serine protease [Acidobacteriota bacterium]
MSLSTVKEDIERRPEEDEVSVRSKPIPYYTYILLACIGAVFLTQFATSGDPAFFQVDRYSAFLAGFDKQAFLKGHEYWRILTGAALHSGILHVVMNSYALYSFGRLVELLSNRAHLAIVFILSALGGGILSLIFNPDVTSVGASGGIVGLLSYLAVYAFKRRQFISPEFRKNLIFNIGFILVFGLVLYDRIDNFGHIGGLITGAVYAFIQVPSDEYIDPRVAGRSTRALGVTAIVTYILTSILTILLLLNGRHV